jgi:hypothetical protein
VRPSPALLDHAVGEAAVYVQGASLKTVAALLAEAFQLPDHQSGADHQNRPLQGGKVLASGFTALRIAWSRPNSGDGLPSRSLCERLKRE